MDAQTLIGFDQAHLWHPYSTIPARYAPYWVQSAKGVKLDLQDVNKGQYRCIDGMSAWWTAIHGYNHPKLNQAIRTQLKQTAHVMFGGLTHECAIQLAQKLIDMTPAGLNQVFFTDSGSVAIEAAIKMAIQYWQRQGKDKKCKLITPYGGYHGDTFMAMSVCDPVNGMHHLFSNVLSKQFFVTQPKADNTAIAIDHLNQLLAKHHHEIAALILEPVVQNAGGMNFYDPAYLQQAYDLTRQYDVLFIADEIATGFGRTGALFACETARIVPDILCLGKALSGGYMTLAATLTTETISTTIGTLMHGPTFMANPLACAVACASIDLLLASDWQHNIAMIERTLSAELTPLKYNQNVADVRVLGAIGVIEMNQPVNVERIQKKLIEYGVWLRPFGRLIYTTPPFIASRTHIKTIAKAMRAVVEH